MPGSTFVVCPDDGKVRSFHVANISAKELLPIIKKNVKKGTTVYTD